MPWYDIVWNFGLGGNVEHIAEHGLTPDDVETVICDPLDSTTSRSSGRPVVTGYTSDGRLIIGRLRTNRRRQNLSCHSL